MSKVGHVANRLTAEQFARFLDWLRRVQRPDGPDGPKLSQKAVANKTGVQQSFVHNLLTKNINTTVGTARTMMLQAGTDPRSVLGTEDALGRYEGRDMHPTRGQVLDALSAFYDEDFLTTCQTLSPPPGSEGWTHHRWNRYIVELRDMWDSGYLKPKRGPPKRRP